MEKVCSFRNNEKDLFEIVNSAEEIITHNLKPLLIVLNKENLEI